MTLLALLIESGCFDVTACVAGATWKSKLLQLPLLLVWLPGAFGAAFVIARVAMMLVVVAVKVMIAVTIPAGGSQDVAALLWLVLLVPQCLWLCVADGVVAVAAGIA